MGGKYEIIGWEYPYRGYNDLHEYTNSWLEARRLYRKAKKMFYSAFIVRNDKHKKGKTKAVTLVDCLIEIKE